MTTVLSLLTIIATLATAIPAFYQAFLQRAKVYYSVVDERLAIPARIDRDRIRNLLVQNGIPSAYVRVRVMNRGTTSAKKVFASVDVAGKIAEFSTSPPDRPRPVWVGIEKDIDLARYPQSVRMQLSDLIPEKVVTADVSYADAGNDREPSEVEVVADGELADRVARIEEAPRLTLWSYLETPAEVLGIGVLITVLAGLLTVVSRNREIADAFLLLAKEINPAIFRLVAVIRPLLK